MLEFHLQNDVEKRIVEPDINQTIAYANRCSVALETARHSPKVILKVSGDYNKQYKIDWLSPAKEGGYRNPNKNKELGAVAISFLLAHDLLGCDTFFEGIYGEGIDYWLSYSEKNPKFSDTNYLLGRLEVSGMEESPTNRLEDRVKGKKMQTTPTDPTKLDAYVCVVDFVTPKAIFVKK